MIKSCYFFRMGNKSIDAAGDKPLETKGSKDSIVEAAKNYESDIFQDIQKKMINSLEEEKTDIDTSIGTWM